MTFPQGGGGWILQVNRLKNEATGTPFSIKKGKGSVCMLMKLHLRATGSHLSYEITQCYLPPDTSEHTLP